MPLFGRGRKKDPDLPQTMAKLIDLPDFPPEELAAAVRHLVAGATLPPGYGPQLAAATASQLSKIAISPEEWPSLKPGERVALLTTMLFAYAFNPSKNPGIHVDNLYVHISAAMPAEDRLRVVKAVAQGISSNEQEVAALVPIISMDRDPTVVSTAALEYSLLCPLDSGDAMTGVKRVIRMVQADEEAGWRAGAVLGGAVMNGDRRVPELLEGSWTLLDQEGKRAVNSGIRPALLFTGTIEFYLRWLEDPYEQELGMPAATLAVLPTMARHDGIVREVERSLPANYQLTPDQVRRNPPIREIQQWSIPDYGRTILPRLEAVWEREGRPEALQIVMQSWSQ